jgi:hypothetical protein
MKKALTLNNIIAVLLIIAGLCMCGYGTYEMFSSSLKIINNQSDEVVPSNSSSNVNNLRFFSTPTNEEKNEVTNYLANKYGGTFNVLEHTTRYCINPDTNPQGYIEDFYCKKQKIINDLYKVEDESKNTFYVKKVTVSDGTVVNDTISKFQSSGLYDSYVIYYKVREFLNTLIDRFSLLGNYSKLEVVSGIGVERPNYMKENNKYVFYSLYETLGNINFVKDDLNLSFEEYLNKIGTGDSGESIMIHVKYDYDLTEDNIQEIVKTIVENNYIKYDYSIICSELLFEFNNKIYIEYSFDGSLISFYKYDNNILDSNELIYDKSIIVGNEADVFDGITYEDFMNLNKDEFVF